jgi:hypothetical protein
MGDRELFIEHDQGHSRLVCLWGNDGFELGRIANMCGSRPHAEGPGALAHFQSSLPGQGVASLWIMFCACAGQRQMALAAVIETMEANGRRNSLTSSKPGAGHLPALQREAPHRICWNTMSVQPTCSPCYSDAMRADKALQAANIPTTLLSLSL